MSLDPKRWGLSPHPPAVSLLWPAKKSCTPPLGKKKKKTIFAFSQMLDFSTQKWRFLKIFLAMCYPCGTKLFLFGPNILIYPQILPFSEVNEKCSPLYQSQNEAVLCLNPCPQWTIFNVYNWHTKSFPLLSSPHHWVLLCKRVCHP